MENSNYKKGLIILTSLLILFSAGSAIVLLDAQEEIVIQKKQPVDESSLQNPGISVSYNSISIEQKVITHSGICYALSRVRGFLVSFDGQQTWIERNPGLPCKIVRTSSQGRSPGTVRHLTALGVDPVNEGRIAVTTAQELFLSENYGASWERIPLGKPMSSSSYPTSVALSPEDLNTILIGTSFNGFFETKNRGKSWQDYSQDARFLYRGAGFYEEISGLTYHPYHQNDSNIIILACGFGHGIYISSEDRKSWEKIAPWPISEAGPGVARGNIIRRIQSKRVKNHWLLEVQTLKSLWHYNLHNKKWRLINTVPSRWQVNPFKHERICRASNKFGIYISSFFADGKELDRHLKFLSEHGLNSIVVDFKDDSGWITYDTSLELPYRTGAVSKRIHLEELLQKAHERGIYVIGRLVVFKDRQLFNYADHMYAAWDKSDQPWRYLKKYEDEETGEIKFSQNEYWVDPFCTEVWDYNIAVAGELQDRGVDEIQFDYIRFPSDGDLSRIRYRYREQGMTRIDALESFLSLARERIHIPISTDLYGFNSWHRMGNWIGQSIDMLADYVDVICPMFYPSHFPKGFLGHIPYLIRAMQIYQEGTNRASSIVGERSIIRPYIQAFLIGGELKMTKSEYSSYLINQIEGTLAAPSSGFTLWNASNKYYMVVESLKSLIPDVLKPRRMK